MLRLEDILAEVDEHEHEPIPADGLDPCGGCGNPAPWATAHRLGVEMCSCEHTLANAIVRALSILVDLQEELEEEECSGWVSLANDIETTLRDALEATGR